MNQTYLNQILNINDDPSLARQTNIKQELQEGSSFMRSWWIGNRNQSEMKQINYLWSLIYGWQLEKSNKALMTQTNSQDVEIQFKKNNKIKFSNPDQNEINQNGKDQVQFISQGEAIIYKNDHIFWINPEQIQEIKQINIPVIVVLTSTNLKKIINYYRLKELCTNDFKLIATQNIYLKMKELIDQLNSKSQKKIQLGQCYMLKIQEYFEYDQIQWFIKQNCWYQWTYDLTFTLLDGQNQRTTFLIQMQKINETKLIYYGWKKNYITEARYQQFIREWDKNIVRPNQNINHFKIKKQTVHKYATISDWFLEYNKKELIKDLLDDQKDQILNCCELLNYISGQIIAKKEYLFDFIYILLQGTFQITQSNSQIFKIGHADCNKLIGLQELKNKEERYSITLKAVSDVTVFRISKHNMQFLLYDYFSS